MTRVPIPPGTSCTKCFVRPAHNLMHVNGASPTLLCFECADELMRRLAPENVASGATIGQTAEGYYRWRIHVERPTTWSDALEVAGATRLAPGAYAGSDGTLHIDAYTMCVANGYEPTPANQATLEHEARRVFEERTR